MAAINHKETASVMSIFEAVEARIPSRRKLAVKLMTDYAKVSIHDIKVENVMNGMRGLPAILWEVSQTDENGVRYHGKSLRELEEMCPKWKSSEQVSPEALAWFLYTAEIPTRAQLDNFVADLMRRAELPEDVKKFCDAISVQLPPTTHMMMSLAVLSRHSKFAAALDSRSVPKTEVWRYAFEDALDLSARFPMLAARIYSNIYRKGRDRDLLDATTDLSHNFALKIGRGSDNDFVELTRCIWAISMDHGTNVSAHTIRLSGSAWADIYMCVSAGVVSGTGPLHAKAVTASVAHNIRMSAILGPEPSDEAIEALIVDTISKGQVMHGFGHALLRGSDPRFHFISRFMKTHKTPKMREGGLSLKLMDRLFEIVPDILRVHVPRMKNPGPNIDAMSGGIMVSYGLEPEALVVFAACGRAFGISAQYVWDRALGLPLERPKSVTMDEILSKVNVAKL